MRPSVRSTRFPLNTLTAAVLAGLAGLAQGLPQGGQVTAGSGSIDASGSDLTVNQDSAKLVIDWQSFGVASGERVQFLQPDASAVALNRVLGNNASEIYGQLTANGQVFLTNPNGILFGSSAQVDVGGMVASTLTLSNADFLAGHYVFSGAGGGTVTNQGRLTAADGGVIALLAPTVRNEGLIAAPAGAIGIGAGRRILLDMANGLRLEVEESALNAVIENHQAIRAEGGTILLTASAQQALLAGMINNTGVIEASSVSDSGGVIRLVGGFQSLGGSIDAGGTRGGTIEARGHDINQFGRLAAEGRAGAGGRVDLVADAIVQPDSASISADGAGAGGTVYVQGHDSVFTSGALSANGGQQGGAIVMRGNALTLAAATLSATGANAGGRIRIGGDFQGQGTGQRASSTWINAFSTLDASATQNGDGGSVVVWSDSTTAFAGTAAARGGAQGGNGGRIEISSGDTLQFAGLGDAGAANGAAGTLLLDPKNIFITDAAMPALQVVPLPDPTPTQGDQHGSGQTQDLGNGTLAQASPDDDFGGTNAGAVYVYRQSDGALLSMLTGSHADDRVGSEGIITLANGNFLVNIPNWDNGSAQDAGAVAFVNAGVNGVVSSSNALVGGSAFDQVGSSGVSVLKSGNYLVQSAEWDNGAATDAGAVTWGNGDTGITGVVSVGNSLVGSHTDDRIGDSVFFLSNGNYLVRSPDWDNGALIDAGAVTFGNSLSGIAGAVSASNSLVGGTAFDHVGGEEVDYADDPIVELANGNYVVSSSQWDNGTAENAGAATWGSGTSGVSGVVSAANSLVGTQTNDRVSGPNLFTGVGGIIPLANGNYLVSSSEWDNGSATNAGAATWGSGTSGVSGTIDAANSLVGGSSDDQVGGGSAFRYPGEDNDDRVAGRIYALPNGNYVVASPLWDNGIAADAGAVTFGNGETGTSGVVDAGNSLVGTHASDFIGGTLVGEFGDERYSGVVVLSNGNYVVRGTDWDNGSAVDAGAATWGSGVSGVSGEVSSSNSLVGTTTGDRIGDFGIVPLSNGNYLVRSVDWDNGGVQDAGAVTFGNGTTGISGAVSAGNSLVGSHPFDNIGLHGITELANGNYVVRSLAWDNGAASDAGAVTWGSGTSGVSGVVSAANSLVGSSMGDRVGEDGIVTLANGNYLVRTPFWDNGSAANAGAVTFGNGATGTAGVVSPGNSLVGSHPADLVGLEEVTLLANGNYVVASPAWHNGSLAGAGAVTWGSGTSGVSGEVSVANSLVGSHAGDMVGFFDPDSNPGVVALSNGNYVVASSFWDNGSATDAGAVTFGNGASGVSGVVSASNSLVGSHTDDRVGGLLENLETGQSAPSIVELANGNYAVISPLWDNGSAADAGAVTLANGTTGIMGPVSSFNSLVGTRSNDSIGLDGLLALNNGDLLVRSPNYHDGTGRVDILRLVPDGGAALTGNLLFGDGPDADVTLTPGQIAAILNTGTNLTLQANTDITLNASADIVVNNPDGNGGDFTLQAGRNININSDIITDNGDLTLRANEYPSRGVVTAERDPGAAQLAVVSGVTLDAGNGNVNLTVAGANYGNDSQLLVSDGLIRGAGVRLLNQARNGDIVLEPGAQLLATGSGLPLLVGTTNGGDLFSADGAAPAQTPDGFWLAFEVKPSRFNFAFGDIDGIIRRGSRSR